MTMKTYLVGDIHACLNPLTAVLNEAQFNPQHDRLIAVGDLIGRGPQPLQTLEFLYSLGDAFICTLGNHDFHFLAVAAQARTNKDNFGFTPILQSPKVHTYIDWLRQMPLCIFDIERHFFVSHAGISPQWSTKQASLLAKEVEQYLQSSHWHQLFASMYGNYPDLWHPELAGMDRYRYIINAFTRMRYCRPDMSLELSYKDSPNKPSPEQLKPWYSFRGNENLTYFFGHWASLCGKTNRPDVIGLDTGCVWGGKLTLYCLETGQTFTQVA